MATSLPRQKLFGASSTGSSTLFFFLFFVGSTLFLWLVSLVGTKNSLLVSGEVPLEPDLLKVPEFNERVPRSIIPLDGDFGGFGDSYNNPTVLEGGNGEARSGGGDAYESLRQLGLSTTQSFIRRRLFNTSVALTVPLFSFTLPQRAAEGSTIDLANQAIFGLFALLTTMLVFAVPVLFTGIRPFDIYGRSMNDKVDPKQSILEHLMSPNSHVVNLMGTDMKNKIGLNPDQCLQKTICDAHRYPKKYGLFALPLQIFFPPPPPGKESSKSYSKYQEAAGTGEYKTGECWAKYNCFFDLMDLAIYLVDYFNPPAKNAEHDDNLYGSSITL